MERMGPYKLETVLGRGGMGTVYRAVHQESNESVAVKVLAPAYSEDDHFRNRFESEIKALLKLDHPNIVRLISYGQEDQNLYFSMELVEGKSLFQIQRDRKPFHWREVIRIAKNVALGLRHAHDRGIIHRDLKPGNLLRANTGIIKITDFGIAKSFGHTQNTGTNVVGTVDFMSPEQAKGNPVTVRSDLYSLGTVMFTLLAGRPPFSANSVEEAMRNLTKVPAPRVGRQSPDVPQVIDDLIAHLLEKKPDNRIPTAMSLYHHLKQVEQELLSTSQAKTAERPSSHSDKTKVNLEPSTNVDPRRISAHTVEEDSGPPVEKDLHYQLTGEEPVDEFLAAQPTATDLTASTSERKDFFKTVTDEDRIVRTETVINESPGASLTGKLALGALLLTVVAVGAYGIIRANQVESADSLFAQIEESRQTPQKRLGEIKQFLKHYPDHENVEIVKQRQKLAFAFQKAHQLRLKIRAKGQDSLSNIETRFLSIINRSSDDIPESLDQLKALIHLYDSDDSIGDEDRACIDAAKAYLEPFEENANAQLKKVRAHIENQMERAKNLSDADAILVYQSIIDLNKKFSWVSDLIDQAQENIDSLKK